METKNKVIIVRHFDSVRIKVKNLIKENIVLRYPAFLPKHTKKSCERPCVILRYDVPGRSHVQLRIFAREEYLNTLRVGEYITGEAVIFRKRVKKEWYQNIDIVLQRPPKGTTIPILLISQDSSEHEPTDNKEIILNPEQQKGSIVINYH